AGAFWRYNPKLFRYQEKHLRAIHAHNPALTRILPSVYPAITFNVGNAIICCRHRDPSDLAHGWCAIWAGGNYNPDMGGHLILYEWGLVIRFPPGSVIFIPSSIVNHGNTLIQEGETRVSFTQYCSGALIRWAEFG
ncbi:hypothetical protein CONPUDRAFT_16678, partial [Coniophora puteana RWD-64-598 SS2]